MGYSGFLVQIGGYTIPMDAIYADSYKITKTIIDLDPFRNAEGILQRNALKHAPVKIEFKLKPMYEYQLRPIIDSIRANMTNPLERKGNVTFYNIEDDKYDFHEMYMPDITFQIYGVFNNIVQYDETTLKFISY